MNEISGFGGSYEAACRKMVIAALEWLDIHTDADLRYKKYKNVYGLTTDESEDLKKMQSYMMNQIGGDCTGAMMQASLSHIMFVKKNGWEKYVKMMSDPKRK